MITMYDVKNATELNLGLKSTVQELPLWHIYIEIDCPGGNLMKLFEQEPLLPGIILTRNQRYVGMISRRVFFEYMTRPYSLGLFSKRPIDNLYNLLELEIFVLSEDTPIVKATQMALQRATQLVYEPILIEAESGRHGVLDFYQLLLAHSQIHVLTLAQLQQTEEQSRIVRTNLRDLQDNHTRLVQNEKMAALGQLVAGVAHEINNPVNFIAGNIDHANYNIQDLLQLISLYQQYYPEPAAEIQAAINEIELDFLTADLPKLLTSMKVGTGRIQEIVRSLRNFSRLDEAEKKAVDIHEGIDSTLLILHSRLKPYSGSESITIIKEYGNIPLVECYAGQLNQVFMNILCNAIDALEEEIKNRRSRFGKEQNQIPNVQLPSFLIRIRTEMADSTQLVISIADNGPGITEDVKKHIFDPFFTTKSVGKGTGLGLSISYQIVVEKHGGQMYCISEPGKGTEFIIKIPVLR
ncbi:sensor histidine kinase [Mastigocladopsis repens]|uniref:sensor histidine kinase n=1 Tax=Mastigocladopsis repens TaxID=221287 RepID=UPI000475136C|nr:ATP-binding protein [Mastigocladopsis repens]